MNALLTFTFTVLVGPVVTAEPEWRVLPGAQAHLLSDGRFHLRKFDVQGRVPLPGTNDLAPFELTLEDLLYVDRRGTRWSAGPQGISGAPAVQGTARKVPLVSVGPASALEDSSGRIWFTRGDGVQWFDGKRWQQRDLLARARELNVFGPGNEDYPSGLALVLSPDRHTLYAWGGSSLGFWVISGEKPDFLLVNPARGLPYWFVENIVPLDSQEVLVFPGPVRLGPRQWATERPVPTIPKATWAALTGKDADAYEEAKKEIGWQAGCLIQLELLTRRKEVNWRLGEIRIYYRYAVLDEYRLDYAKHLSSADGCIYIYSQRVWNVETGTEWERGARPDFLFRYESDGRLRRMPREWEEFEPNFIDRNGELWAWWPTVRHSAGGRIRTLCGKTDNQPVRAGEVAGFDNSGRLAFTLFGVVNTLFIYTPGGAAVPEAPVIWQETAAPEMK